MKTYIIKNNIEKEIEARDEDEAMQLFYEELANENSCLEHYTTIEEKQDVKKRLEEIRQSIKAENISYGEIAELQELAEYIEEGDNLLLEWAGVKEK